MKKLMALALSLLLLTGVAVAQLSTPYSTNGPFNWPNWYQGYQPTAQQWALMGTNKVDYFPDGIPIEFGGTGANTAAGARSNLGVIGANLGPGQTYVGDAGSITRAVNLSGDGTLSSTGALTVTSTGGVAFGPFATGTSAANLTGALTTAVMNSSFGSTQGQILYRNATGWVALNPGTNGNYLQTQGAAANPQWAPPPGGTINSGTTNQIAIYSGSTTISGTNALPNGTTATTQSTGDNSTKIATTAYSDAATTNILSNFIPIGMCFPYGGSSAPNANFLLAFGQAISRATYSSLNTLFSAASYPFGNGNGTTTFNLPDLRGRVPAGVDNMGGSAASRLTTTTMSPDGNTAGATGGVQSASPSISVSGTVNVSGAGLSVSGTITSGSVGAAVGGQAVAAVGDTIAGTTAAVSASGANTLSGTNAVLVVQPTVLMNWICRVQ